MLGNTNRGEIGEEFIRRYLRAADIEVGNGGRTARTDLRISDYRIEVKTASLGATGTFQFNHVRLDRDYNWADLPWHLPKRNRLQYVAERRDCREEGRSFSADGRRTSGNLQAHKEPTGYGET